MKKLIKLLMVGILLFVATIDAQEAGSHATETVAPEAAPAPKPDKNHPVTINFVDMELSEVITNISKITGKNFIWDEKIRGKVTIISPTGIPVGEAYRVFEAVLRFNGYQLVPVPGVRDLYKIMRIQEVIGQPIPTYVKGKWSPPSESYITRLIPLKYIDVADAVNVLNNLKSSESKILPYPPTNTMIIIESANNLNRLLRILDQMDIPVKRPAVRIVRLQFAPADQLAGELNQIFSEGALGVAPARAQPARPTPPPRPGQRPPQRPGQYPARRAKTPPLKIIADTRTNSLIIIAMENLMDEVLGVIDQLDITIEGEEGIHVYYCKNADATDLASTLSSLAGSAGARSTPKPPPGRPAPGQPPRAPSRPAPGGAVVLGTLGGDVRITADEPTNSLVIVASRHDYQILLQVIKKLDIRRKQVFVEAVILEIELNKQNGVGTSFAAAQSIENQAAVFASTALGGLNSLGIIPALTSGTFTDILPGGFSVGAVADTVTIDVGGTPVEVPTFSALFNALVATNNVNVLSTPNLLTTDNEEAEIIVGQNVPIPTGSTVGTGGVTTSTIQRQNVGIKLTVTPQISESETIRLVLFTEISGVVQTAVAGIDVNTLGITTSIKSAQTTVVVDNNQTVVIGGLIEERDSESVSKVPLLGDIPLLGWLFKSKTTEKRKTNLVILLTPHIVRDAADMNVLTEEVNRRRRRFLDDATGGRYKDPFYIEPLLLPSGGGDDGASFEEEPSPDNGDLIPYAPEPTPPTSPAQPSAVPIPPQTSPEGGEEVYPEDSP